ncbi:MAG: hypothetical protein JXK05_04090 [Campylobacterales bacterium]|nr:hypothetical protein [Campylobacterales bacterium]
MKKIYIALLVSMAFLMAGCSTKDVVYDLAEPFLEDYGLHDDSTFLCGDLWGEKVECPSGLLQKDFAVPGTSGLWIARVCFGFADSNTTWPDGMECWVRNFLPDSNSTSTIYIELSPQSGQSSSD